MGKGSGPTFLLKELIQGTMFTFFSCLSEQIWTKCATHFFEFIFSNLMPNTIKYVGCIACAIGFTRPSLALFQFATRLITKILNKENEKEHRLNSLADSHFHW